MNIFSKIKASLRLREAIKMAKKAHRQTGNRYYVMPSVGSGGKLIVMDRKNFRRLKLKKYINNNAHVFDMVRECFYCTPYANGDQYLSEADQHKKVKQYFAWLEYERKQKKLRKQRNHGKVRRKQED
jgi:hypothetical protein